MAKSYFKLVGEISDIEVIARRSAIRQLDPLRKAHGVGRKRMKIKRFLE